MGMRPARTHTHMGMRLENYVGWEKTKGHLLAWFPVLMREVRISLTPPPLAPETRLGIYKPFLFQENVVVNWEERWVMKLWREVWTASRGSHLHVTSWSIYDQDQDFWLAKTVLDWLIVPSKLLIAWFLMGQRSNYSHVLQFGGYLDPLISFDSILIPLLHGTYKWLPLVHVAMMLFWNK